MPRNIVRHPSKFEYKPLTIVPCRDFNMVRYVGGYDDEKSKVPFIKVERIDALGIALCSDPDDHKVSNTIPVGYMLRDGQFHVCNANLWYIGLMDLNAPLHVIHALVQSELQMRSARNISRDKIIRTPIRLKDDQGVWYTCYYEEIYPHEDKKAVGRKRRR